MKRAYLNAVAIDYLTKTYPNITAGQVGRFLNEFFKKKK